MKCDTLGTAWRCCPWPVSRRRSADVENSSPCRYHSRPPIWPTPRFGRRRSVLPWSIPHVLWPLLHRGKRNWKFHFYPGESRTMPVLAVASAYMRCSHDYRTTYHGSNHFRRAEFKFHVRLDIARAECHVRERETDRVRLGTWCTPPCSRIYHLPKFR
jgi:hypothetical protein